MFCRKDGWESDSEESREEKRRRLLLEVQGGVPQPAKQQPVRRRHSWHSGPSGYRAPARHPAPSCGASFKAPERIIPRSQTTVAHDFSLDRFLSRDHSASLPSWRVESNLSFNSRSCSDFNAIPDDLLQALRSMRSMRRRGSSALDTSSRHLGASRGSCESEGLAIPVLASSQRFAQHCHPTPSPS